MIPAMRKFIKYASVTVLLIAFAAPFAAPRLIDREALRTQLIGQLSTALGRPINIARLDVQLLPQPAITLEQANAILGDHPEDRLNIGRIRATLDAYSLFERQLRFTQIEIESLSLNATIVDNLRRIASALSKGSSGGSVDIRLQQVRLSDATWTTDDGLQLGPFSASAEWQDGSMPQHIVIAQQDNRLQAQLTFTGTAIDIRLQAHDWNTPVHVPLYRSLQITNLQAHARYSDDRLEIIDVEIAGAAGHLRVRGSLGWREAWRFDGKLTSEQVDMPLLLASFGQPTLPGHIRGECTLELQAPDATELLRNPGLDCRLQHALAGKEAQLRLTTRAEPAALSYTAQARNLILPVGPALHFDTLELHGRLVPGQITFSKARASAYNGVVDMQGDLSWRTGWQWNFTAHSRKLRLDPLLAVFDQYDLDGKLDADCQGKFTGATFSALFRQPGLNCEFLLTEGVLRDTDLEKAARLIKLDSHVSGDTPFDRLSGHLRMRDGQTQFTGLKLHSTALEAKGDVRIDRDKKLSGELNAGVKNTGGMVSVPLVVSGTVADPVIRPTASAMAGGAAGTVLLGPGVGTAVGVKVGEAVGKLTGWLKPKSASPAERD